MKILKHRKNILNPQQPVLLKMAHHMESYSNRVLILFESYSIRVGSH